MDGEPAVLPLGDEAAQLHGHGRVALDPEALPAHIGGGAEGGVGVALHCGQRARKVRAGGLEQQGPALGGRAVRHHWERRDVDHDRVGRVFGERRAIRHHHRHGLADIAHLPGRDDGLLERPEGIELLLPQWNGGDAADIGRGDDGVNARPPQRGAGVDRDDAPMGNGAAQDHRMQQPRPRDVVHIFALAAQEAQVLHALDRASDQCICRAHGMPWAHLKTRAPVVKRSVMSCSFLRIVLA